MKFARWATCCVLLQLGCGQANEAPQVGLPVVVDSGGITAIDTDLGYRVELDEARVVISDLVFTVAGEVHTVALLHRASEMLIRTAHAHPGHSQGGEVTGELPGSYVIDWASEEGRILGTGTLIAGTYTAANFVFASGTEALGLPADDPLIGHTAIIRGTATRDGTSVGFTIVVDSPEGRELIGAPFEATIDADATDEIRFRFEPRDPIELDTVFAGIDFIALDDDQDGVVLITPDDVAVETAYNDFRRVFQTHDHFRVNYGD